MAYSQAQLEALEAALAKGERRVTFADKTVEYRTVEVLAPTESSPPVPIES
jgi:hypothetical protein